LEFTKKKIIKLILFVMISSLITLLLYLSNNDPHKYISRSATLDFDDFEAVIQLDTLSRVRNEFQLIEDDNNILNEILTNKPIFEKKGYRYIGQHFISFDLRLKDSNKNQYKIAIDNKSGLCTFFSLLDGNILFAVELSEEEVKIINNIKDKYILVAAKSNCISDVNVVQINTTKEENYSKYVFEVEINDASNIVITEMFYFISYASNSYRKSYITSINESKKSFETEVKILNNDVDLDRAVLVIRGYKHFEGEKEIFQIIESINHDLNTGD